MIIIACLNNLFIITYFVKKVKQIIINKNFYYLIIIFNIPLKKKHLEQWKNNNYSYYIIHPNSSQAAVVRLNINWVHNTYIFDYLLHCINKKIGQYHKSQHYVTQQRNIIYIWIFPFFSTYCNLPKSHDHT